LKYNNEYNEWATNDIEANIGKDHESYEAYELFPIGFQLNSNNSYSRIQ